MVWNLFGYNEDRGQEATGEDQEAKKLERNSEEWTFSILRDAPTPKEASNQIFIQSRNNTIKAKQLVEEKIYQKDYETNCTSLYKKIEEEDWNSVFNFLETGKWPGHFFADSICPDVQVRTWIKRSDPKDRQKLVSRQLPLHLAIVVVAPYRIIRRLVEMYPESVRCTDSQRHLPVHNAMRHGNPDRVVDYLLSAFPAASESTCLRNDGTLTLGCMIQEEEGGMEAALSSALSSPSYNSSQQLSTHSSSDETSHLVMRSSSGESQLHLVGSDATRTSAVSMMSQMSRASEEMIDELKLRLEGKESELGVVQSRLDELNKTKAGIEDELAQKMQKLKSSHCVKFFDDPPSSGGVEATTMLDIIKLQQRLIALEAERHQLELVQQELKTEESDLQYHLERFQGSDVESIGNECSAVDSTHNLESLKDEVKEIDLESLKDEVTEIECRLDESHDDRKDEEAASTIHRIPPNPRLSDAATKEDIQTIQKTIEDLFRTSSRGTSTKHEIAALKGELDALRRELKDKEEASQLTVDLMRELDALRRELKDKEEVSRLKVDLILLANALERNLKNIKDEKHLADARVAMKSVEAKNLETRSIEQLRTLKTKFELITAEFVASCAKRESETADVQVSSGSNDHASPRTVKEIALSLDMGLRKSASSHQLRTVTSHELQLLSQTSMRSQRSQTSFHARIPRPRYRMRAASLIAERPIPAKSCIKSASSLPADKSKRLTPRSGKK